MTTARSFGFVCAALITTLATTARAEDQVRLAALLKQDAAPHWDAIEKLYDFDTGKKTLGKGWKTYGPKVAKLASLATECSEGKYKGLVSPSYYETLSKAEVVCPLAIRRDEILRKALDASVHELEDKQLRYLEEDVVKNLGTGVVDGFQIAYALDLKSQIDKEAKEYAEGYTALGGTMPDGLFQSWMKAEEPLKQALAQTTKVNRHKKFASNKLDDASLTKEARRLAALDPDAKLISVLAQTAAPDVQRDSLGSPMRKRRMLLVVVQRKGDAFCRGYDIELTAEAIGANMKFAPYAAGVDKPFGGSPADRFLITSCK